MKYNSNSKAMKKIIAFIALVHLLTSSCHARQPQFASYDQAQLTIVNKAEVAAVDPGVVKMVEIVHGQKVVANQLLLKLDDASFEAEKNAANREKQIAELQAKNDVGYRLARKTSELNEKKLERSIKARRRYRESISATELDQLRLELEQSRLEAEQANFDMEIGQLTAELRGYQQEVLEERLRNRSINSPLAGVVVDIFVNKGEWVNAGQPVARVINLEKLRVKAFLKAEHQHHVNKDSTCHFLVDIDGVETKVPATIYFVSPELNTKNQDFEVWADIDNSKKRLFPGQKGSFHVKTRLN